MGVIKIGKSVRIPHHELYKWLKKYNTTPVLVWFIIAKCTTVNETPLCISMEQLSFRQKRELDKLINQAVFRPGYRLKKSSLLLNKKY